MTQQPLSVRLRDLRNLFRKHVGAHQRPSIDACRELVDRLTDMAEHADTMEVTLAQMEAVAADIEPVAMVAPADAAALRQRQAELQAHLDAEDRAARRAGRLAPLAAQLGDTNVVSFPIVARPVPLGGGDAA